MDVRRIEPLVFAKRRNNSQLFSVNPSLYSARGKFSKTEQEGKNRLDLEGCAEYVPKFGQ